jgi:PAS domain S-box-containing protein
MRRNSAAVSGATAEDEPRPPDAPEPIFDDVVRVAAAVCATPVAVLTLVEDGAESIVASFGTPPGGLPPDGRDWVGLPTPLLGGEHEQVGTLWVYTRSAPQLSAVQTDTLRHLARSAVLALEVRRSAAERQASHATLDKLRQSEAQLALAVDAAQIGLCELDLSGNLAWIRRTNESAKQSGEPSFSAALHTMYDRIHPEDRVPFVEAVRQAHSHPEETIGLEFRLEEQDGTYLWILLRARILPHPSNGTTRVIGCFLDVSPTKLEQEAHDRTRETLHMLSRRLLEAQEDERRRIARELHDDIGQMLTGLKLDLYRLRQFTPIQAGADLIDRTCDDIDRAIHAIRTLSLDLRPSQLDTLGLEAALQWHVERARTAAEIPIEFVSDLEQERLPPATEIAAFRIVQEALTNVIRHARARHVTIEIRRAPQHLGLLIEDDGCGFDPEAATSRTTRNDRLGLAGIQERAGLAGGEVTIWSEPGAGTTIRARLPLEAPPVPT